MKKLWQRIKEWNERRRQEYGVKKWEHTRIKGKKPFVLKRAIFFSVYYTMGLGVWDWIQANGWSIYGTGPRNFVLDLVSGLIASFISGYYFGGRMWDIREKQYLNSSSQLK